MDCPHCLCENLIGASVCAGCGASFRSRPAFAVPPTASAGAPPQDDPSAPPPDASSPEHEIARLDVSGVIQPVDVRPAMPPTAAPEEVLCRICTDVFSWRQGDAPVCPTCRQFASGSGGDLATHAAPAVGSLQHAAGGRSRSVAVPRPSGGPRALVACLLGGALVVGALGVVRAIDSKPKAGAALTETVRDEPSELVIAPPAAQVVRFRSSLSLHTVHRDHSRGFGTSAVLGDARITTEQETEISLVRTEARGAVVDSLSRCRLASKEGRTASRRELRDVDVFPAHGHDGTLRVLLRPSADVTQVDGAPVVTGRDVVPLLTLGTIGAQAGTVRPGAHWRAEIELPCTTDPEARLLLERFPAEVRYLGRSTYRGFVCAAFRITALAPAQMPKGVPETVDRRSARIAGVVLYELETGLLAEGSLDVEQRYWAGEDRKTDDVEIEGRLDLRRN